MARAKRSDVFDPDTIGVYHCYNRVVRRSYLCGFDKHTGNDYSHRRGWFYDRLKYFADCFAIDVLGYAVLSNHYHLVLRNRPDQANAMTDRQVVTAWLKVCPGERKEKDGTIHPPTEAEIERKLRDRDGIAELRRRLSNPSWLIRQLDQYMGIRCNSEDNITGHFWEARFGMKRLLDEAAVLACLAYVDLNPIRGKMAESLEEYPYVSIGERLRALDGGAIEPSSWLAPIALQGETDRKPVTVVNRLSHDEMADQVELQSERPLGCLPMELEQYAELLRWLAGSVRAAATGETSGTEPVTGGPSGSDGMSASADQPVSDRQPESCQQPEPAEQTDPILQPQGEIPKILPRMGLDPVEFLNLVAHFEQRFFTAVGCPASLRHEARRRGRGRLNGPGRHALSRRPLVAQTS